MTQVIYPLAFISPRAVVALSLLTVVLLYVLLNFREAVHEFKLVFSRNLIRRFFMRFSILQLPTVTSLIAMFFAIIRWLELPPPDWFAFAIAGAAIVAGLCLCYYAVSDIFTSHARRRHPDHVGLDRVKIRQPESKPNTKQTNPAECRTKSQRSNQCD